MTIQHRNIPDAERHEVKGASTAPANSVLKSNGDGTTSFGRIGVASLEGSLDSTVAGKHVVTDASGGLMTVEAVYGRFSVTAGVLDTLVSSRIEITGNTFSPDTSGWYVYHAEVISDPMKVLKNVTLGTDVFSGVSGLVYLDSTNQYSVDLDGFFSIVGVQ